MRKINIFVFVFVLYFFTIYSHSATRKDVIDNAYGYANFAWMVGSNNILDEKKYIVGSTIPISGHDGIDDRMGVVKDSNNDERIDEGDISVDNITSWPFYIGKELIGEAYAYGLWDSSETFKNKILSNEKWIAGNEGLVNPDGGYKGFTGSDCSGLLSRIIDLKSKRSVDGLMAISVPIKINEAQKGDFLYKLGASSHSLVISEIYPADESGVNGNIKIIHNTTWRYSEGNNDYKHSVGTVEDVTPYALEQGSLYLQNSSINGSGWDMEKQLHYAYTAFPLISCIECGLVKEELKLFVRSKKPLTKESLRIIVDEGLAESTTVYFANIAMESAIDGASVNIATITWPVILNSDIKSGTHTARIFISNELDWKG